MARSTRPKAEKKGEAPAAVEQAAAGGTATAETGCGADEAAAQAAVGPPPAVAAAYTVVARRYRPSRFAEVIGQDHVVRALSNAIRLRRIAQAYLFCGTRGVGKTSIARIFAKCLNCVNGPTVEPCLQCDACQAIAAGQDVDVIEIDGASNNGVEQVRELRQNASLRPSRSRYKIYYIDEVHMLSTAAFNALLKTLEEPPAHVKFFFATTEPNKIPITVLSRCQRYDFAGITPDSIAANLARICQQEGVGASDEALLALARRAGGSMRDAQSLLESLLASGASPLELGHVQMLLGTASEELLLETAEAIMAHDAAQALHLAAQAQAQGVQPGDLLSGLIDVVRDLMVVALGADALILAVSDRHKPRLQQLAAQGSVDSITAILQILAEHRARMRGGTTPNLLLEIALVKAARIDKLEELAPLVEQLRSLEVIAPSHLEPPLLPRATPPRTTPRPEPEDSAAAPEPVPANRAPTSPPQAESPPRAKASPRRSELEPPRSGPVPPARPQSAAGSHPDPEAHDPAHDSPSPHPASPPSSELEIIRSRWRDVTKKVGARGWALYQVEPAKLEADILVLVPKPGYNDLSWWSTELQLKIQEESSRIVGRAIQVRCDGGGAAATPAPPHTDRAKAVAADPLVQQVVELFEARPLQLDFGDGDEDASTP